jgi:hypothetical protein
MFFFANNISNHNFNYVIIRMNFEEEIHMVISYQCKLKIHFLSFIHSIMMFDLWNFKSTSFGLIKQFDYDSMGLVQLE